ncbi:ThuA domain-containing protein [Streptomyces sp. TRM43335]|uniref:ThuA domain-containing protein n=1 Tax=Streptomyces taklimakanensis TaxID=2569853 RepID=A0A6G2BI20_9ACTN|nr:ThuA domain-containing protein [Streptomyces taklimakanensis]MTE21937.1 ThuA domain-containing protein [Streptomyces taklimakanensis]
MDPARITVFTRTTGYRHDSIPHGVDAFRDLAATVGLDVTATEDPEELVAALRGEDCRAVVFLSTSGVVLTAEGRRALRSYVEGGGAFVGVHAATTTEEDWPWYGELLGARFDRHPALQPGVVLVEDRDHPATAHLDASWPFTDEWYDFRSNPRGRVRVLLSADESTYEGGGMGEDHPLAWCHRNAGGRVFYTALGHTEESYADPVFRRHLLGGLTWAARLPLPSPSSPSSVGPRSS